MGWSGGTEIMVVMIDTLMKVIAKPGTRRRIYRPVIEALRDRDWDTEEECLGMDPAFDSVLKQIFKAEGREEEGDE
jgi:hypothetical protein